MSINLVREQLRKVCENLNSQGVQYMLIGGVAVGFYGFPRSTADIDFWYNPTLENFHRIIKALDLMSVDTSELHRIIFDPQKTYLRIPQLGFRTEFLPMIPGIKSFPESFKTATKTKLDGIEVFILGYHDLIKNKEIVNRPIDINDVEELKKRNQSKTKDK